VELGTNVDKSIQLLLNRKQGTELDDLIEFEVVCGLTSGKSKRTVELTCLALKKLRRFLVDYGLSTDITHVDARYIRAFILHLQSSNRFDDHPNVKGRDRKLSGLTVNGYMRSIRAAWNRWVSEGLVESSPFDKVKVPNAPKKVIPTFSPEQLITFFNAIDKDTAAGFRDYTLFLLYLDTACRLSEITNAHIDDLNMEGMTLRVVGKGNRERIVPFGVAAKEALSKYIHDHRPQPSRQDQDFIFMTKNGDRLTNNRVLYIMKRYGAKARLTGVRCSPHTIRHTACTLWIRNGGDIFTLQRITGHSSLEVLQGYVNLVQTDINLAHKKNSPVDNLGLRL
jgi:integrase/recombinase XerD